MIQRPAAPPAPPLRPSVPAPARVAARAPLPWWWHPRAFLVVALALAVAELVCLQTRGPWVTLAANALLVWAVVVAVLAWRHGPRRARGWLRGLASRAGARRPAPGTRRGARAHMWSGRDGSGTTGRRAAGRARTTGRGTRRPWLRGWSRVGAHPGAAPAAHAPRRRVWSRARTQPAAATAAPSARRRGWLRRRTSPNGAGAPQGARTPARGLRTQLRAGARHLRTRQPSAVPRRAHRTRGGRPTPTGAATVARRALARLLPAAWSPTGTRRRATTSGRGPQRKKPAVAGASTPHHDRTVPTPDTSPSPNDDQRSPAPTRRPSPGPSVTARRVTREEPVNEQSRHASVPDPRDDQSLFGWADHLKVVARAMPEGEPAAAAAHAHRAQVAAVAKKLATAGENDQPAHASLRSELSAVAAELDAIGREQETLDVRYRNAAARMESLPTVYQRWHDHDEARLETPRQGEARADYSAGIQDR